jgi:hypothetical protein
MVYEKIPLWCFALLFSSSEFKLPDFNHLSVKATSSFLEYFPRRRIKDFDDDVDINVNK